MFIQVIEGRVDDRAGLRRLFDRWHEEHAPRAEGWLGTTSGVADDGTCVIAARFATPEDAHRNSDRPEQGAWWEELVKHFDAPPTVHDCGTVRLWRGGGSDDAGFVQVISADVVDASRLRDAIEGIERDDETGRPDVLGGVFAVADDATRAIELVYFTNEEEARAGEAAMEGEPADDPTWAPIVAALGPPTYTDLRDPWLSSP